MPTRTIVDHQGEIAESRANSPASATDGPALAILRQYWPQLQHLLPSHIKPAAWYAAVYAALFKGTNRTTKDQLDLFTCANQNPESLMFALFEAARLGLDPGTEQYYLTPRPNKNAKNGVEVLGIKGYQGEIELIYRAGAVSTVVVEVVRKNDKYRYRRGVDKFPLHEYDPWVKHETRGDLVGVYSYCVMKDGATSRVVELNQDDIDRAIAKSPTKNAPISPWKTDTVSMWLKTAVHRIQKFVPTSSEYLNTQAVVHASAVAEADRRAIQPNPGQAALSPLTQASRAITNGSSVPDTPLDPRRFAQPPAPEDELDEVDESGLQQGQPAEGMITKEQLATIADLFTKGGVENTETRRIACGLIIGRELVSATHLTATEAEALTARLNEFAQDPTGLAEVISELIGDHHVG